MKRSGITLDLDKVKRLIKEKNIDNFSCGLIDDAFWTMGEPIEAAKWDGKDLNGGYVTAVTWGKPGIQDQDGNLYPAFREMTQADFEQADKKHKEARQEFYKLMTNDNLNK